MQKTITLEGIDAPIILARRKGTRHLKITVKSDGSLRLSVPYGVPEFAAKQFLRTKKEWIVEHVKQPLMLRDGDHIGKNHTLRITTSDVEQIKTRVTNQEVIVTIPTTTSVTNHDLQQKAISASERALKKQAERLLPQRIEQLATQHRLGYTSVTVKKLKSRWGACSSRKELSFNIYLMQLSWPLIDYVILHELAHTVHQHHQASFWQLVEEICPDYKVLRKELKSKPVSVHPTAL